MSSVKSVFKLLLSPGLPGRLQRALKMLRHLGWSGFRYELALRLTDANDYSAWVRQHDLLRPEISAAMRQKVKRMPDRPLIAIAMSTCGADPQWLRKSIDSVRSQIYPYWELCIVEETPTSSEVQQILRAYQNEDSRIKVTFELEREGISASTNTALSMVSGKWVALLNPNDLLPRHALYCFANCICAHPDVRMIYSDEDKINHLNERYSPYFKPDWNIDLFRSQNFFSTLGVFSTELARKVGGIREGMEGFQNWDLALRCIEQVEPAQIFHIPRVLYHRRSQSEDSAQTANNRPSLAVAGEVTLNEHFLRTGILAKAQHVDAGFRVAYALPSVIPRVSIVVPTRNALHLLRQCVDSIINKTTYLNYEIIIVDNGSDDPQALAWLDLVAREHSNIRVLRDDRKFNYSALNNNAIRLAEGEVVALVNNDIEVVSPDWLTEMTSLALQPGVGAVGARLWYPNGTLQHGGVILGIGGLAGHAQKGLRRGDQGFAGRAALIQSFSAVTAACLVVRKEHYLAVGGLDEVNLEVAFNDVDFCLKLLELGLRNVWTPYAELIHHESATRGMDIAPEKRARFEREVAYMKRKWRALLQSDPAYNPNLTLRSEDFALAWPPRVSPLP